MFSNREATEPSGITMSSMDRIETTPSLATETQTNTSTTPLKGEPASDETNLPLGQVLRLYPKAAGHCLALSIIIIGWGYDLVVIGTISSTEPFLRDYGEQYEGHTIIPSLWLSLWMAANPLGMALGSVFSGWFQDVVGRKRSLAMGAAVCAVGVACIFFSCLPKDLETMRAVFFVGKVIQGFSIGQLKATAMTYVSETAPTALRGSAMGLIPTANLVGQLLGAIVSYVVNGVPGREGYLGALGSQWILTVMPLVLCFTLPESPSYLVQKGRLDDAMAAATKLYAPRVDASKELDKIRESIAEEEALSGDATYMALLNKTHRRRTVIVLMANLVPALFGLDLVGKASYFMQTIGMASSTSLMIVIGGVVAGTAANVAGMWILSRVGRRKAIITSFGIIAILWTAVGIAGIWKGAVVANFIAAAIVSIIIVAGMGCWPAGYAVMGETSSLRMRAKTQGLGGVVQQMSSVLMNFTLPYLYNLDAAALGGKTGFVYVGTSVLGIVMTFFAIPEMKGRSALEIDRMFELKLPVRKFKHWNGDEEPR